METPVHKGHTGSVKMEQGLGRMCGVVLDLTLEIVYLLVGEAFNVVKESGGCIAYRGSRCAPSGFWSPNMASPPHTLAEDRNNRQKILELSKKIAQLLTGEVAVRHDDVAIYFSMVEWEYLERHKDLYKTKMTEDHQPPRSLGESKSQNTNAEFESSAPSTRCACGTETNAGDKFPYTDNPSETGGPPSRNGEEELQEGGHPNVPLVCSSTERSQTACVQVNKGASARQMEAHLAGNLDPVKYPAAPEGKKSASPGWESPSAGNSELYRRRVAAGEKPCSCSRCGQCFSSRSELAAHVLTHTSETPFACSEHGRCFSSRGDLLRHRKRHAGEEPFLCSLCGKRFVGYAALARHRRVHADSHSEGGKCFTSNASLVTHQLTDTGERPFLCPTCGKCFSRVGHLLRHQQTHTGSKPFSCSVCSKRFSSSSSLGLHERTHTGEKPFSCSHCGNRFNAYSSLIRHGRRHTGEKPYSCSDCGKRFAIKSNLVTHLRVHTGERPFVCAACGKRFSYKSILVKHQRTHTGEKPFACSECGRCFSNQSNLVTHHRIHTGEKPYACSECRESFKKKSSLVKHQKIHTENNHGFVP